MSKIITTATAQRTFSISGLPAGQYAYAVHFNGERLSAAEVVASDLPQARGIVRRALRAAFASRWNQGLIASGVLTEGEVSRTEFRRCLREEIDSRK